jgi:hypothetical protein
VASAKRVRMYIRIDIGCARMPRLAASAKRVCMYVRMLMSMYIRIGIGGARMPPPLTSMYVHTYRYWMCSDASFSGLDGQGLFDCLNIMMYEAPSFNFDPAQLPYGGQFLVPRVWLPPNFGYHFGMHACTYVCVYVCVYACMLVPRVWLPPNFGYHFGIYIHTCIHTYIRIYIRLYHV